ncbi:MAG TPA: rhomboid family intramembrane serine protease [Solirubrobacteraceae bacterium]|jgi:membrane associated rhomboid family serine protease
MATCYRHPSRETGVSCSNCGNPICPDCMTPTPVGMRCPDCARQKTKVRTAATMAAEPRVTYGLIAINVAAFFAQVIAAGGGRAETGEVYEKGLLFGGYVHDGEWWRLVTSGFLHANPIHLLLNMVVLYFLGQMIEPAMGSVKFAALYFASLLAGSFGVMLIEPGSAAVGASGAVYGLIGAALVVSRERGIPITQSPIFGLLVINVMFTFLYPGISIGAHLGGLVGGGLAALLIVQAERRRSTPLAIGACAALAIVAFIGAIAASAPPY